MSFPRWIRKLREGVAVSAHRIVRHSALGLGVLTVVAGHANAAPNVAVCTTPDFAPEAEAKKLGGKYVLQRTRIGPRVIFPSHRSHASHPSPASHYSSSTSPPASPPVESPQTQP